MLAEYFHHLLSPAPTWLKDMGYVRELIAIEARHRRCRQAWAPHLERCRRLIASAALACPGSDRAVILGSGPLLDVPLDILTERFREGWLVDIVHPSAVRKLAERLGNVRVVERDLSGVSLALHGMDRMGTGPLPEPAPDAAGLIEADFVASVNLLSQLPLTPLDFIENRLPRINADQRQVFARSIIDHHLALLQGFPGRVSVITEVMRLVQDGDETLEKVDPLYGAMFPYQGDNWTWAMAPLPEISRQFDINLSVVGVADLAAAPQVRQCRNTTLAAP